MNSFYTRWRRLVIEDSRFDRVEVPVYESSGGGRIVPLLKTLMTNYCGRRCAYCPMGWTSGREAWDPKRLAEVALYLYRTGQIGGIFLSSAIPRDPDSAMDLILSAAEEIREMGYGGYLHVRVMPGASKHLVRRAAELADRAGLNLEAPKSHFDELCPYKDWDEDVMKRFDWLRSMRDGGLLRSGLDTQLVVGASGETDLEILKLSDEMLRNYGLKRIYYSGFEPAPGTPLEGSRPESRSRVLRLYRSFFLLRDYGIGPEDLSPALDGGGMLAEEDPKLSIAKHIDIFPIDPNDASPSELVLVPGIGPKSAAKIVSSRRRSKLRAGDVMDLLGFRNFRRAAGYLRLGDRLLKG